jgi:UDP-GlcNAc:undecaprenyl-phosphate GlcNAc-1-phosphate transferase
MTVWMLWLATGAVGAATTWWTAKALVVRPPLRHPNHRGITLPSGAGIAIVIGIFAGAGLIAILHTLFATSDRLTEASVVAPVFAIGAAGFALLGLWDDLAGAGEHGWRTHLSSLLHLRPTPGAMKAAGGYVLAFVIVAPVSEGLWWTLADAAIVAMAANLMNLLDVRPGRAGKGFGVAVLPMLIVGGPIAPILTAALGATAALAPLDLRERVMLGDAGANALGAVAGLGIVALGSDTWRLVALLGLLALQFLGERPGLSRLIDAAAPLRAADRAGTAASSFRRPPGAGAPSLLD